MYKASDIKLLIPQVVEAAGIIPTSSTTTQLALGDALAIAAMKEKKFGNLILENFIQQEILVLNLKPLRI